MTVQPTRRNNGRRKSLALGMAFLSMGIVSASALRAEDGSCDVCTMNAGCDTAGRSLPKLPCLGDGLFDHLQRITSKMESGLNRLAFGSKAKVSDSGCDPMMAVTSGPSSWAPSSPATQYEFEDSMDQAELEFPKVIPESNSSPSIHTPIEIPPSQPKLMEPHPSPRPGNPFLDEVRANPGSGKLPKSIARQEVFVLKRSTPKDNLATSSRKQSPASRPPVSSASDIIQVGGLQSSSADKGHFSR